MRSGVGDYTYHLASALVRQGADVAVFTSATVGTRCRLPSGVVLQPVVPDWGFRCIPVLRKALGEWCPDIIHIQYPSWHNPERTLAVHLLPLFLRSMARKPSVLFTLHEATRVRFRWLARPLVSAALSDVIICVDEYDQRLIQRWFPWKQVECIHIGAGILPQHRSFELRERTRSEFGLVSDDIVLIYFGAARPTTGIDLLLQAYAGLAAELPHLKLLLVSELDSHLVNDYIAPADARRVREKLDQLALWNRVIIRGYSEAELLSQYMASADVGVFPYTDGVARQRSAALSCLAHGLPVVTTTSQWLPNDYLHRENVFLVPPNDLDALVAALRTLTESAALRVQIAQGAQAFAEKWTWTHIAQQTQGVYNGLMGKGNK
jgi:glycosyltransferase involved in cell wall biosynthesis